MLPHHCRSERVVVDAVPRLLNVQYLRGAAALGVVVYHAGLTAGVPLGPGAWGVDIFFVISGFLMVLITGQASRPWPFLRDRLIRIAPLYWIATCASFALYGRVSTGGQSPIDDLVASFAFIPLGESGDAPWFFPVLNVGWTLNFEMLFYLVFAGSLFFPRRWQLAALTSLFLGLALIRETHLGGALPWQFWGHPIIFEFLAGAALGTGWAVGARRGLCIALCGTSFGALAALALSDYPLLAFSALSATAILVLAVLLERARMPLRLPLLLGDASYSIYLWHYLGIGAAAMMVPGVSLPPVALVSLYVGVGVTSGLAAHFLLERPLLSIMRRRRWKHGIPVPGGV